MELINRTHVLINRIYTCYNYKLNSIFLNLNIKIIIVVLGKKQYSTYIKYFRFIPHYKLGIFIPKFLEIMLNKHFNILKFFLNFFLYYK